MAALGDGRARAGRRLSRESAAAARIVRRVAADQPGHVVRRDQGVIVATYKQNALHKVQPGDHAELTLNFYPGKIFKAKVHSIVRTTGAGQLPLSGVIPGSLPPVGEGRLVVRFELEGADAGVVVPGGTQGRAAIYTQHLKLIEIVRKVILRFEAKFDYIVFELHLPSH